MRSSVFAKVLVTALVVIAAATLILDVTIRSILQRSLEQEIETSVGQEARLLADQVNRDASNLADLARQAAVDTGSRVTILDASGRVLADSGAERTGTSGIERLPEFAAALRGTAASSRRADAGEEEILYVAVPLRAGGALRLGHPLASVASTMQQVRGSLLRASGIALLLAATVAALAAYLVSRRLRRIVGFAEQVAQGNLSARIEEDGSDEIAQVASALDKTARRLEDMFSSMQASRQQMLTVLNSMQEPVVAVSDDQTIQWANGAMERLTGGRARPGAAAVEALRDPDFLAALRQSLRERNATSAHVRSVAPGRAFDMTAAPMPGGVVAVLHDLTAVERVEKTRRDFIANVSHELRTPLTSIQGYSETLLEMAPEGPIREFAEVIRRNADRMGRLTNDLLTLARVESGEQKLQIEDISAREIVAEAVSSLRETARTRGVELVVEELPDAMVKADRDAIHQVFTNLIDNAVKYGANGGRVQIGAVQQGTDLEFYVCDFGPGIGSQHLPRLFERFYRVDKARSQEAGGTGLGLAIVKHIVLNHGGEVRAESTLGHGCTFHFSLPLAAAVPHASQSNAAS
ncbi:MAG: ATP-binding protein [Candidatus Korobacteraceae bacterium]